jgi:energy-coupling factor transporter ATP-binding protein EcfA2
VPAIGAPRETVQRRPVLTLADVVFHYQAGPDVVRDVNLEVQTGEPVAIIGAHGAGKTTLAKLIVGLLKPTGGSIRMLGEIALQLELSERLKRVGLVLPNPDQSISERTVVDEIAFPLRSNGLDLAALRSAAADAARLVGLEEGLLDEDPTSLSLGTRKRVAIATALVRRPELLILDEPAECLDGAGRERLLGLVRRLTHDGAAVVIFDHLDLLAEVVDRALLMKNGAIVTDAPVSELFGSAASEQWHEASVTMPRTVRLAQALVNQLASGT